MYLSIYLSIYLFCFFCKTSLFFGSTSKTKQLCETSFKNGEFSVELTASYQCVLMFFYLICLKYCACHEKVRPGHTKCCTCHATSSNLKSWCSKMQSLSLYLSLSLSVSLGKSAPWPPNISDAHVSCTEPATRNASLQLFFKGPTHAIRFSTETKPSHFTYFWQGAESIAPATKNVAWASKNGSTWCAFTILIRNVLRATTGSTFLTAQLPKVLRRWRFHFEMCFAPQSRALFQQLNCQKCSDTQMFLAFWLGNALRATVASLLHVSTSKTAPSMSCHMPPHPPL